ARGPSARAEREDDDEYEHDCDPIELISPMAQGQAKPLFHTPAHGCGLGATNRQDAWWAGPLATAIGLGAFIVYSTFRAIYHADFELGEGAKVNLSPAF